MAIKCHYIDQNFNLKNSILAVTKLKEYHTAENLASVLQQTFEEWEIAKKATCIMTDNAPNMIKICELLQKWHLPCFVHSINLVVQDNLKLRSVQTLRTKCKKIVRYLKNTTEEGKQFCTELQHSVQNRLFSYEKRSITRIATIIDPRFKKKGFLQPRKCKPSQCIFRIRNMPNISKKGSGQKNNPNGDGETESAPKKSLFSFIGQKNKTKVKSNLAYAIIIKGQYLETPNSNEDTDPLLFWKVTGEELNPITQLCQKYFCIPGTSVESERTFSRTGAII
ncbi:unnamed protein product [Diabrotica balteata]|uniref:HAT C-terminal dimerisation domain-containing protein n=1 Tax=Diabrotica balteata TaxID=107213 RepID=A0A9N9XF07_DIABA|nr:unnamed protein product [Diabrotica balteata]